MIRGKFISFEGSEGCGKSTQIRKVVDVLESAGHEVLLTREPGGTVVGEKVRDLLQHTPEASNMTDESELLLFAASRAQLVRELIQPALEQGTWVIADRFLDSTTVYQGIARGLDRDQVEAINRFAVGELLPDLTILLDLDAGLGHSRAVGARGSDEPDRIEDQPLDFFEKVRQGYLDLAARESRIVVIDAGGTIEEVSGAVQEVLRNRLQPEEVAS